MILISPSTNRNGHGCRRGHSDCSAFLITLNPCSKIIGAQSLDQEHFGPARGKDKPGGVYD